MEDKNYSVNLLENLFLLIDDLAIDYNIDPQRFDIKMNEYGEFETIYDGKLFSNYLTYDEARGEIISVFKGIEMARKE